MLLFALSLDCFKCFFGSDVKSLFRSGPPSFVRLFALRFFFLQNELIASM